MKSRKLCSLAVLVTGLMATVLLVACGQTTPAPAQTVVMESRTASPMSTTARTTIAASPAPASSPTPTGALKSVPDFAVLPFFLTKEDSGDGWEVGMVDLAFANTSDHLLEFQKIDGIQITVQTLEGKDYPADLFSFLDDPESYEMYKLGARPFGLPEKPAGLLLVGGDLPLPRELPISMATGPGSVNGGVHHVIQFRYAQAAHPTRLTLSSPNFNYTIDLLAPGADSPSPALPSGLSTRSLVELPNALGQVNSKLQIDFGQCAQSEGYPYDFLLPFRVTNANQLDEEPLDASYAIWYSSGVYLMSPTSAGPIFKIGPGQTVKDNLKLADWGVPTYFVLYSPDQTRLTIYRLECKARPQ
jgi:hypothetical protein